MRGFRSLGDRAISPNQRLKYEKAGHTWKQSQWKTNKYLFGASNPLKLVVNNVGTNIYVEPI